MTRFQRSFYVFLLLSVCLICSCRKKDSPDKKVEKYLENAIASVERGDWAETRKWFSRIEEMDGVNSEGFIPFLNQGNEQFQCYLIGYLGNFGDKKVVEPLIELLQEERGMNIKLSVIEALGKLKDERVVEVLEKCLKDDMWGVRFLAASALEEITGRKYEYSKK